MLEAQPVERLSVVNDCNGGGCPGVFEIVTDLVPQVHEEVADAAPFDPSILVGLAGHLGAEPVQNEALVNLGR